MHGALQMPTDDLPQRFEVERGELGGAPAVAARGEVDINTVPALDAALDAAIHESVGAFVVDLTGVEFLDSSGLGVLLRARALLGREERALAVVCPHGPVRRVFELSGVADLFSFFGTRDEAADALVPPG